MVTRPKKPETRCVRCDAEHNPDDGVVVGNVSPINGTVCNDCFAAELVDGTVLKRRQAEVYALIANRHEDEDIADILDISESTVASHRSNIKRSVRNARRTLDWISEERLHR